MTTTTQTHTVVRSYHDAWLAGDVDTASTFLADTFTNLTSINNYYSVPDYVAALRQFASVVARLDMISELYGDNEATLVYDVQLATPVGTSRIAEHFRLTDGKISSILTIFDGTAWREK